MEANKRHVTVTFSFLILFLHLTFSQEILLLNPEKALLDLSPIEPPGCEKLILLTKAMPTLASISDHHSSSSLLLVIFKYS